MKQELHALVGAYAVDALDDLERRRFEDHLAECEICAQETRGLREAAAQLGTAVAMPPPARLRERVLSDVARVRPLPPLLSDRRARRGGRLPWLFTAAAAACLVLAVVLGGVTLNDARQRADQAEAANRQMVSVLTAPDAEKVNAPVRTGGMGTVVASRSQGKAVVVLSGVAPLPNSQTYELWFMGEGAPRPAGLTKPGEQIVADGLGGASQIGLTVEPAGGSDKPTSEPILAADLPT
jgi:anti-sigma-K factor RskA